MYTGRCVERTDLPQPPHLLIKQNRFQTLNTHSQQLYGSPNCQSMENMNFNQMSVNHGVCPQIIRYQRMLVQSQEVYYMYPRPRRSTISNHPSGCRTIAQRRLMNERINSSCNGNSVVFDNQFEPNSNVFRVNGGLYGENLQQSISRGEIERMTNANHPIEIYNNSLYQHVMKDRIKTAASEQLAPQMNSSRNLMDIINNNIGSSSRQCDGNLNLENFSSRQQDHTYSRQTSENFSYPDENRLMCAYCTNCQKAHNIYQQCQISNGQVQNLNLLKRKIPNQGIGSNNSKSSDDKTEIKSLLRKRLLQSALKDILNNGNDKTPDVSIQNGEFCPFVSDDSNIEGRCQGTSLTKTSNSTSTAKSTQKNKNTSLTKTSNSTSTAKSTQKNKKGTPVNGDNKSDCVNINEGNASPGKNICVPKKMSTSITDTGTTNPDDRHTVVNSDAQIAYLRAVEQWKMDHSYNSTTHIGKSKNSSCGPTHESLCDPSRDSSCNLTHDFTCGPTDKSSCDPSRDSSCNHTNDLTCDFIKDYSCDPSDETFFYSKDRICAINPEARLFHDRKKIDCNLSLEKGKSMNPECPVNNHENIKSSAPFCDENGTNKDGGGSKFVKALANIVKELFSHRKNKSKKAREQSEKIIESQMNKSNKAGDQSEKINDVITVGQMSPSQITKSKEKSETHSNETKNDNKIMSTDNTVLEGGIDKGNSPTRDLEKTSVLKSTDRNVFQCLFVPVNNTFIKSNLENSDGRSEDAVEYCLREDNTANIENLETNYGKQDEKEANVVDTEACCIKLNDKPQDKTEEIETVPTYEINALNVTSSDLNSNMEVGEGHFINDREYSNTNTEIGTRNDSETYKKKSSLSNLDNGDNAQTAGKDFSFLELGYCPIALPLGCHEYDEESEKDDNNNELLETSFKDENNVNRNKYMVKLCNNKYNHDKTEVLRPWILTKLDEIPKPTVWKEFLEKMDRDNTMVYTESNHVDLEETIASPDFDEERDHVYDLNLSRIIESPSSSPSVDNANESLSEWKECNSQLSQVTKEEKNQIKQRKSSYETQEEKNQPEVDQENNLNNYQMVSDVMINIADDDNKQFANFETRNDKFDLKENAMKQNSINLQPTTGEIINNLSTPCSKNINDEKLPSNDNKEMSLQNRTLENENENRFMYDKPSCVVDSVLMNKAMDMSCQLNNINSNLQISEKADRKIESARKNVKTGGKKYRSTDAKLLEEAMHFICSGKSEDESTRAMIKCFYSGPISTRRQKSTFPTVGEMKQGKKYGRQSNVNTLKEQRKQKLSEEFVHDNEVVVVDKTDKDYIHKDAEMVFDKTDEDYVHKTGEMVVDRTDKDYVHKTGEMVVDKTDIDYVCKDAEMVVDKKESVKDKVPTTIPNIKNNDLKHENELRIVLADSNADSNSKNITFHENSQQKLRTNISEKESEALTGLLTLGNGHVLDSFIKDYEYDCRNDAWKKDTGVLDSINDALKKISREHDNRNVTVEDTGKLNTGNDTTICTEEYDKNVTVEDTCVLDNRNDPTVDTGKCDIRNVTAENTSVLDIRNDALKKISGEHDNRNVTVKDTDVLDSGNDTNVSTAEYDKNVTVEDTCVLDNRNDTTVGTGKCDIRNVTVENTSVLDSRNDALKKISGEHDNRNVTVEDTGLSDIRNDTTVGTGECDIRNVTVEDTGLLDIRNVTVEDTGLLDIRNVTVEDTGLLDIRNDTTVGTGECDIRNVTVEDTGLLDIRNDTTVGTRECDIRNVTVEDTGLLDIRNDTTVGTRECDIRNVTVEDTGLLDIRNDTTVGTRECDIRNVTVEDTGLLDIRNDSTVVIRECDIRNVTVEDTGLLDIRNDTTVGTGEPNSRNDTTVGTGEPSRKNDTTVGTDEPHSRNDTLKVVTGAYKSRNEITVGTDEPHSRNDTLKVVTGAYKSRNDTTVGTGEPPSRNDTLKVVTGAYKSGNDTTENKSECYTGNNTMEDINGGNETWKATRELDSKNDTLKDTAESSCGNNKLKKNIDDWESGNDTLNKKSGHYTLDKGVTPNIQNTCSLKEQAKTDYVYLGKECSTRLSVQDIADREFDVNDQSLGSEISAQNSTEKEYVTTAFIQNIDVSKTRNCTDCISQHEIERAEDVKLETRHENETSNLSNKIDFDSLNDIVEGVAETMSSIEQETFITHETIQNTLKQLRSNNCTQTANTSDLEENEVFFKTNTSYLSELDAAGDNSSTSADENPLRLQTRGKAIKECNFEDIIEKRIEQLLQEVKEKRNSGKLVGKVLENYDNCSISTTVMVRENVISEVNVVQTVSEDNSANDLRNVQNQNSCCSTEGDDDDDIIPATEKPRHVENSSGKWLIPILERLNIDISKGRVIVTKSAQKLFLKSHVQTHSSRPVTTLPKFASFGIEEDSHSTKNGSGLMRIDEVVKYDDVNTSKSKKRKKINSLDETIMELRSSAASSNVKAKKQKTKTEETDVHASTKITRNKARKTLKAFKLGNEEKEIKDKKMKSTKKNYLSISTADDMENIDSASKDKTDLTCDASNNTNKSKKTAKRKLKFDKELNEPRCKVSVAEDNPLGTVKNNINMKMAEKKTTKHRKKRKPYSAELLRREENLEFDCEKSLTHVNEKLTSYQQGEPLSLNSTEETKSPVHLNKDGIKRKKKVKDGLKNFKPKSAKKSGKNLSEPKVKSLKKISANKLKKFDATKKTEDGKVKFRLVTEPSEQKIIKLKADALKKMYAVKTCGYCHKIVPSRQYSYHVKSRHPYRCAKCGILFQTKTEKTAHRREKHNLERYHCLTCNQFFDLKFHYQVHVKSTRHINTRDIYRRAINWMKSCLGLGSSSHENLPMLTDGHTTILDSSQNALVPAGQVGFLFSEAEDVPFSDHEPEVKALLHDLSDVKSQLLSNANNVSNFQYGQSAIFECNTFSGKMVQNYVSNTTFYASDNAQFADFPVSALRNQDNFSVLSQNSFATNSDNFSVASQNSLSIENHDYSSSSSTIDLNESSYMENSNNELNNGAENMDFPELSNTSSTATKGLLSDVFHLLENDGYFESDEFKSIDLERNIDLSDIDIAEELCELSNVELSHLTKDLNAMQNNNLYNQIIDSTDNYTLLDISTPNVPGRNKSDMTSRHFTVSNLHSDFRSDTLSPASVTTLGDHQDLPFSQNSVSSVEAEFNAILQDIAQSESMGV